MSETQPIPAPDTYFAECVAGAERAGLTLIGRAAVASTDHAMRNVTVVHGTTVPVVVFLRRTTLFCSLPGSAFLLQAVYVEEQVPNFTAAAEGRIVAENKHPYWKLTLTCGTLPGRWESSDQWLYVADVFDGTRLHVSDVPYRSRTKADGSGTIQMAHKGRSKFDKERDVCDGTYGTLLGWWPDVIHSEQFGEAMASLVDALRPHLRAGKLLREHGSTGIIPLDTFPACADAFVAQFPPERLLEVMDEIPFGLRSPEEIADLVASTDRVYARN